MISHNELTASMINNIRRQLKDWVDVNGPDDATTPVWGNVAVCLQRIDELERIVKDYVVECEKNIVNVGGRVVPDDDDLSHAWAALKDAVQLGVVVKDMPKPGPCPWCHHTSGGIQEDSGYFWWFCGEDGDCSAAGPMRHSEEEAIEAWNQISGWREVLEEIVEITLPSDSINKSARTALKRGP